MRFGIALPHYDFSIPGRAQVSWEQVRDHAQMAEDLGYDSVWVSDHLFLGLARYGGGPEAAATVECLTAVAALAAATKRVRLGTLVLCNDFRTPALVAKVAATIDLLSEGRLDLGLGAGWYEEEYSSAGIRFDGAGKRIERLAESVQIITGLLGGNSVSFEGNHYRIEDAITTPRSQQRPRPKVFVGGKGDRVVGVAARYADGFNSVWAWTPEAFRGRVELLNRRAREAGRDPGKIALSVGLYTLPGRDSMDLERRWAAYRQAAPPGLAASGDIRAWGMDKLSGLPDEISARVRLFEATGVGEVILGFGMMPFQIADESSVELFAREVFPRVNQEEN